MGSRDGWEALERYVDDDVSAYKGRVRPAYRRMLDDLRGGYLDAVVVWDADRLHRQPKELEEFFEVCKDAGVTRLASVSGDIDLATHDGQFLARILGAVTKKESDHKSRSSAVLDHVLVGPGRRGYNRFDPSRLEPVWRV